VTSSVSGKRSALFAVHWSPQPQVTALASGAVRLNPPLSGSCGYQFGYHFPDLSARVQRLRSATRQHLCVVRLAGAKARKQDAFPAPVKTRCA